MGTGGFTKCHYIPGLGILSDSLHDIWNKSCHETNLNQSAHMRELIVAFHLLLRGTYRPDELFSFGKP